VEENFRHDFTMGLEEELLLVDAETLELAPVAERVLPGMEADESLAAHEAYAAQVELRSPPARDAAEAVTTLARLRAEARDAGATLMGAGVHPTAELGDVQLVDAERYRRVEDSMRGLILRTPEGALHVHVGMPGAQTAMHAYNGLRTHLPLLMALSANSPFWFGRDSGMASSRASLVRAYPGRGVPRAFESFDDYAETAAASIAAAGADDYTYLWWDVRPHPRLGTIEVREMDAQSSLDDVLALAGLVHDLAVWEAERARPVAELPPPEAIGWSSFRAARDGLDASLWWDGRLCPVPELAREVASAAGADSEALEALLARDNGSGRQRAAFARGGMRAVLEHLAERTR
jgi:glutamate---cysteine ligase / carboxylate-amine ligase